MARGPYVHMPVELIERALLHTRRITEAAKLIMDGSGGENLAYDIHLHARVLQSYLADLQDRVKRQRRPRAS